MYQTVEIAYLKEGGWHHGWVFDHISCHAAMADNAFAMNVAPGGKQGTIHEGCYLELEEVGHVHYSS